MKNDIIKFRVDDKLKKEIKDQADKLGLTISSYLILLHKQHLNK